MKSLTILIIISLLCLLNNSCNPVSEEQVFVKKNPYDTTGKHSYIIALKAFNNKYVCVEYGDTGSKNSILAANKDDIYPNCIFRIYELDKNKICLIASNKKFVSKNHENFLVAKSDSIWAENIFSLVEMEGNKHAFVDIYRNYVWVCNYADYKDIRTLGLKVDLPKPNGQEKFEIIKIKDK